MICPGRWTTTTSRGVTPGMLFGVSEDHSLQVQETSQSSDERTAQECKPATPYRRRQLSVGHPVWSKYSNGLETKKVIMGFSIKNTQGTQLLGQVNRTRKRT